MKLQAPIYEAMTHECTALAAAFVRTEGAALVSASRFDVGRTILRFAREHSLDAKEMARVLLVLQAQRLLPSVAEWAGSEAP